MSFRWLWLVGRFLLGLTSMIWHSRSTGSFDAFMRSADVPVVLVHGAHDPVVAIDSVRDFADRHRERVMLTKMEDAAQLLCYQNPDIVLEAVAAFLE